MLLVIHDASLSLFYCGCLLTLRFHYRIMRMDFLIRLMGTVASKQNPQPEITPKGSFDENVPLHYAIDGNGSFG